MARGPRGRRGDGRPTRVRQAQEPADLVERLPGSVVDGAPQAEVVEVVADEHQERVPTAHDQTDGRQRRLRALRRIRVQQPCRVEVTLVMIDRDQRQVVEPGERTRERDAHQQRADEARAFRDRDRLDAREPVGPGATAGLLEHRDHPADVGARRHLRHDATGGGMEHHLARDDVGVDAPPPLHDRDRGLIAGGLDGEQPSGTHASAGPAAGGPSADDRVSVPGRRPALPSAASSCAKRSRRAATRASIAGVAMGSVVMIRASSPLSE